MHGVAWRGYERRWGGEDGGRVGLVVRFKWIALSLVVPSPKHYNTSASDLHLSGAPNTGAGRARCLLCNCRLNVQSTLIETAVCARVHVCAFGGGNTTLIPPLLFHKTDCSPLHTCACCALLFMF